MTESQTTLFEYETKSMRLSAVQARRLNATGAVIVTPGDEPGLWSVTAGSSVGSLVVEDVELLIRPKINPDNLFLMLEAGLPDAAWRREAFDYATTGDLLPSVIAFFARTVETTLGRGLFRSYLPQAEYLVALRGRLDVARQINRTGVNTPVACRYDEFTADNAENRYLRAAVRRALRVPRVHAVDRRRLMQQLVALEEVNDAAATADDLDSIVITRLNAHYEPALRLARLILANLTLVDQRGGATASSFLVDMNDLFQRFVTERLRRALRGRLEVDDEPRVNLATGGRVTMYPDLVFRDRRRDVYVGDVKYKLIRDARALNSDYYQLLAYTTALDLPEGVLIYCLADGGRPEREVTVRHADKVLYTRAVDLSGAASAVTAQLNELAAWIAERISWARRRDAALLAS